ncbi:hypothetical protein XM38_032720 [Halomicronema hongdechloris C2206]|uniref:Uncharacterized protein n=1 Tax=Halomicronema hongdechloris C2206 TaxID=1641165 RepID=A0A1Z3HPU6_9CYAN|nr:hypothetical protein [Halomicronema hongdechloris]ASC72315.1 hypothetical protein XM38_032720 [Halomicronema hongdechloris C2206]
MTATLYFRQGLALVVILSGLTTGQAALACFSLPPSESREETIEIYATKANTIFLGQPIRVSRDEPPIWLWPHNNFGVIVIEFEASRVWKGSVKARYLIRDFDDSCSTFYDYVWQQVDGEWQAVDEYVIPVADRQEMVMLANRPLPALGRLHTLIPVDQSAPSVQELTQLLGEAQPVDDASFPFSRYVVMMAGLTLLVMLMVGLTLRSRRASR